MNQLFQGCLLATDLDGTLLDTRKNISEENKKAVKEFESMGGLFTVATGRAIRSAQCYIDEMKVNAPVILQNGIMLYDFRTGEILWQTFITPEVKGLLADILKAFPKVAAEVYAEGEQYYVLQNNPSMDDHVRIEFSNPAYCSMEDIPDRLYKVLLVAESEEIDRVVEYLAGKEATDIDFVRSTEHYYEFLPRGMSKGNALKKLAEVYGIPMGKTFAIGDYYNDEAMIRMAGAGAATGNAPEDLRQAADYVTQSCDHSAVAEFINYLVNR